MSDYYLTVAGFLTDEGTLELEPGFLTDRAPTPTDVSQAAPDALIVESYNDDGELLHREALPTAPLCLDRADTFAWQLVQGTVPFVRGTRLLRFVHQGRTLRERTVPIDGPAVDMTWSPPPEAEGVEIVTWTAEHPGGNALAFLALYSAGSDVWQPVSLILRENAVAVDFDALPGGDSCRIRVLASDGANTAVTESDEFAVARKGLEPLILQPDDGAILSAGPVLLEGQALRWENDGPQAASLRWRSSIDGELGEGARIDAVLSAGVHDLTFSVNDGHVEREAFVSITAQPASFA